MAQAAKVQWDPEGHKGTNTGQVVITFKPCFPEQCTPYVADMHADDACWKMQYRSGNKS